MKSERPGKKTKFSLNYKDESLLDLVKNTDKKTLAAWAIDCVERVLRDFEEQYPADHRPRAALDTGRKWITSGKFSMAEIRGASLASHAAARDAGADSPARSAARAAGQAVATAHVPLHSLAAANYALQAVFLAAKPADADAAVARERDWQYRHLLALRERKTPA